ncbi:MAG: DUF4251 domain-containing protein [Reichenbachiella sp.]|uniref:DUF4251 domain-containing protein n=1 Tax=Reichenbachiella sp. TaxID=2184521 RepID=UPI003298DB4F
MKYILLFFITLVFFGSAVGQSRAEKKKSKKEQKAKSFAEVKEFFENGEFQFVAEWADTQKGRRVNLISNPNSFSKKENKINANLPYFGVVQVATMDGDAGISIENESPHEEDVKYNDKKFRIIYKFNVKSSRGGEILSCIFTIHFNKSASLSIRSSQRNQISYTGEISPFN